MKQLVEFLLNNTQFEQFCATVEGDGLKIPFDNVIQDRLKWGLPTAYLALVVESLRDLNRVQLTEPLFLAFNEWLKTPSGNVVSVGQYVCAREELQHLRQFKAIRVSLFSNIKDATVDSNVLLRLLYPFRVEGFIKLLLVLRKRLETQDGSAILSTALQPDYERYSLLAYCLALCVFGHDCEDDSDLMDFLRALFSQVQNEIDSKIQALL